VFLLAESVGGACFPPWLGSSDAMKAIDDVGAFGGPAVNSGLSGYVLELAIDPTTPSTIYAGTNAGVFSMQQGAVCIGDCDGSSDVGVNEIITLVNIALGTAQPSACPQGIPSGDEVTISLIIQAVNRALDGCGGG
jgi:hypothetical protein